MKIVVSFEDRVRPDSTGVYLVRAFQQLGHEVRHVLPENIHSVKREDADFFVKCDDGLKATQWNSDLHPSHYYCIDTHIETDWRIALANEGQFDTVSFVHSQGYGLNWKRTDPFWVPVGCDPEVHNTGHWQKEFDGCFIGNFHNGLAGPRIEMLDAFFKSCPGPIFFGNRTFREMTDKYGKSKLVFNRSINGDANMRVFEAMCSGSCLVTDRVPDLDKLGFVDGVHYAGYSSAEELASVVKDLLSNDEKRETIARQGREEVVKNHTYAKRMSVILSRLPQLQETK